MISTLAGSIDVIFVSVAFICVFYFGYKIIKIVLPHRKTPES